MTVYLHQKGIMFHTEYVCGRPVWVAPKRFRMKPQRTSAEIHGYSINALTRCAATTYRTHLKLTGWGRYT